MTDRSPDLTRNEALIYAVLEAVPAPIGAYAILDHVREEGIRSPTPVYRALERLQQRGLVHRIERLNAFVACRRECCEPATTIFAICEACGSATEFAGNAFDADLSRWAKGYDFTVTRANCELFGLCRECSAS